MTKFLFLGLLSAIVFIGCQNDDTSVFYTLDKILQAQQEASDPQSLEDWHHKQEKYELIVNSYWPHALKSPNLCESVSEWSDEELLGILPQIYQSPSKTLPCRKELLDRISAFRNQRQTSLARSYSNFALSTCKTSKGDDAQTPWSNVKIIDTSGGPRFVTGDLPKCQIAFTFDDGPYPKYTEEILKTLKNFEVGAVFFQMGGRVHNNPQLSQKVADQGHILANHTWSHQNMPKMAFKAGKVEIEKGFATLMKTGRLVSPFFRFPYGAFTSELRKYLVKTDVSEFFWNMDTLDWKLKNPNELYANVLKEIEREKRGIILFHDVHPQTADILPTLLHELREAGYTTVQLVPKKFLNQGTSEWTR